MASLVTHGRESRKPLTDGQQSNTRRNDGLLARFHLCSPDLWNPPCGTLPAWIYRNTRWSGYRLGYYQEEPTVVNF
jgi:hypothetical protein